MTTSSYRAQHRKSYAVVNLVRDTIAKRGSKTLRGLGRIFRLMDSYNGDGKVDRQEFASSLQQLGVNLRPTDLTLLFNHFDSNCDGHIDFQEFLVGIRGKPNERRQAIIDRAFLKFDHDGNGVLDIADLRGVYNASLHPKVARGAMTEDQVFLEFLSNFADLNRDGRILRDEWNEYYAAVSASIENDEHFIALLRQVWRLD